jgi:hypothetical protein
VVVETSKNKGKEEGSIFYPTWLYKIENMHRTPAFSTRKEEEN